MANPLALAAVSASLALTGCGTISGAAKLQGQVQSGVTLPAWPEECRWQEAHAALRTGEDIRAILKRERTALDRQNKLTKACADFYDDLRTRLMNAAS